MLQDFAKWQHRIDDSQWDLQAVSQVLFPQFQLAPGGVIRLAGCRFDWQAVIEVPLTSGEKYFGPHGPIPKLAVDSLQLPDCRPISPDELLKKISSAVDDLVESIEMVDEQTSSALIPDAIPIVYWCPYITGKLSFEFGEAQRQLEFSGWAQQVVRGLAQVPAFYCELTDASSYRLDADDEGQITCQDSIVVSSHSNRRLVKSRLRQCVVSHQWAEPESMWHCGESDDWLCAEFRTACRQCGLACSPGAVDRGLCPVCRELRLATMEERWVRQALNATPAAANWSVWKSAVGQASVVVWARSWFRKRVWLFSKETGEVLQQRAAWRWSNRWTPVV